LTGCASSNVSLGAAAAPSSGAVDTIRSADVSARFPTEPDERSGERNEAPRPFLFPGSERDPEPAREQQDPNIRSASLQPAASLKGDGVEINFDGADMQTVAKTLLGDILQLNFVVDPRVQGNVTLASAGPIARKDVLPALESALRMSNAAIVKTGNLVKIADCRCQRERRDQRGRRRAWIWRVAGAAALYVRRHGGEDGGKLPLAAGFDPRRSLT
jgi:general secretion pathway protein D